MNDQTKAEYKNISVCDPTSIGRGQHVQGCDGLRGYGTHRLKRDDKYHTTEVELSDAFEKLSREYPNQLEHIIFGNDTHSVQLDEHEQRLMATVIQWLGTPVGKGFLEKAGFVHKEQGVVLAHLQRRKLYDAICQSDISLDVDWVKKTLNIE